METHPLKGPTKVAPPQRTVNDPLLERRYSTLLVSVSDAFSRTFLSVLPEQRLQPLFVATCVAEAKRKLIERSFDLIVVNTPLPDEFGLEFAIDGVNAGHACALVFVRAEIYPQVSEKSSFHGVMTLSKPTSASMIQQAFGLLCSVRERLRALEVKTAPVEEKMLEIRIVNNAKYILAKLQLTDAFRGASLPKRSSRRADDNGGNVVTVLAARSEPLDTPVRATPVDKRKDDGEVRS